MAENRTKTAGKTKNEGGKILPALCGFFGTLILSLVILSALPLTVPRLFGYSCYGVVSGSMAPALPEGSLVYVEQAAPGDVHPGEIIAYDHGGGTVTHRVIENRGGEGVLITRGDANSVEDPVPVPYRALIGRVVLHVPFLGRILQLYGSTAGKVMVACAAASGALLNAAASTMRKQKAKGARGGR